MIIMGDSARNKEVEPVIMGECKPMGLGRITLMLLDHVEAEPR